MVHINFTFQITSKYTAHITIDFTKSDINWILLYIFYNICGEHVWYIRHISAICAGEYGAYSWTRNSNKYKYIQELPRNIIKTR